MMLLFLSVPSRDVHRIGAIDFYETNWRRCVYAGLDKIRCRGNDFHWILPKSDEI
jgi:hypothetical protein